MDRPVRVSRIKTRAEIRARAPVNALEFRRRSSAPPRPGTLLFSKGSYRAVGATPALPLEVEKLPIFALNFAQARRELRSHCILRADTLCREINGEKSMLFESCEVIRGVMSLFVLVYPLYFKAF